MTDFHFDVDADGIATITWDCEGKSMNVGSEEGLAELDAHIEKVLSDDAIKGAVITTGKKDFAAGMDLNVLAKMKTANAENPAQGVFDGTMKIHHLFRKIELAGMDKKTKKGGKPIVAAIKGTALGLGLELPLATHRIFAAEGKGRIGLPEIMVGIFPGGGGTVRLTKKLGAMNASSLILEGKALDPKKAKALGVIEEVVPEEELISAAKEWVKNAKDSDLVKPWDAKGYKMPGGAPYHPAGFMTYVGMSAIVQSKTQGAYPAAKAAIQVMYEAAQVPTEVALKIEARQFTKVLMNPSSAAMIRSLFINKGALEKGAVRPEGVADMRVRKLGVLGAGMMGAGIAYVSANAGIEVVLLDMKQEAADKGKAHAESILDGGIKRKKITEEKKAEVLGRITATDNYDDLKGCDLIVEAVFEDVDVKAGVTKEAEARLDADAIFATNTSTLPITELAKASRNDERFIGIHFFSPVHKMNLVEIIKGAKTGPEAVAKALDFVRQIKKTPIVVNDERFFYANRCIIPYINEGVRMVAEGVCPAVIENAAKQLGMPLGPLQLTDETSIDLGVKIAKATKAAMGDAYPESPSDDVLFKLFEEGRLGRKANAGFYNYDEKGKRGFLWEGLAENWPVAKEQPSFTDVQHRLAMAQTLEAVRALESGVLEDIREGDVGAILGWGFMPWSGGPFSWLDILGAEKAVEITDYLTATYGERFQTPALLREMAEKGESFYTRFDKTAQAA
ncbi:Fatty acid oxidation complex subunit alpha [Pseudoruegeria aquimaris]|uniref:Fatty acid oxidation complex subunit alpha n=1 Tax=Pseudoruegeria aquimaris TaxID=393663 RepID=A0A1Y5S6K2_9RHOB|nr:3-hydroxyacyl-CoA dehydrogenase NAD-binding domain-containing protein [Pseudoruegeria aquimaris]SLN33656.1 Fatty acid oxidation complex subunit alpha [Pseudoruegeria aquimaris]